MSKGFTQEITYPNALYDKFMVDTSDLGIGTLHNSSREIISGDGKYHHPNTPRL